MVSSFRTRRSIKSSISFTAFIRLCSMDLRSTHKTLSPLLFVRSFVRSFVCSFGRSFGVRALISSNRFIPTHIPLDCSLAHYAYRTRGTVICAPISLSFPTQISLFL